MAKKKQIETEIVETVEVVETLPTTQEALSPMVVALQNEINALQEEKRVSRAEFVKQTDKQIAKIKELDETIASKQSKLDEYNALIDSIPEAQRKLSDARNQATNLIAQAETSLKELEKREKTLATATAELSRQKAELDSYNSAQEARAIALDVREKEIKEREKAADGLKKALGLK